MPASYSFAIMIHFMQREHTEAC